ncbi:Cysteine-rich secretory protein family protein [Allorhodopirellula solitaria]|uniref:Cysteine-rich secretory protein family protein n=2 Tax=Allorhodopirellula solitaria TaxID=2527987 RepID=A0A5C5YGG1_9BACT|nr:Cysteine-rich secretory protein family protein [Allorhodopirellula solitaria]
MRCSLAFLLLSQFAPTVMSESPSSSMTAKVEQSIIDDTNAFRKEHELPALEPNKELTKAATEFAKFMAKEDKYGHHADGRTPAKRAKAAGYQYCVVRENIAYRTNTGDVTVKSLTEVFVDGWIDSPPHRENMLADYITQTGVAVATADDTTYYAVVLFGRPESASIQLTITNESDQEQTLILESQASKDEVSMPPRGVVTATRCFPATLTLKNVDAELTVSESAEVVIADGKFIQK